MEDFWGYALRDLPIAFSKSQLTRALAGAITGGTIKYAITHGELRPLPNYTQGSGHTLSIGKEEALVWLRGRTADGLAHLDAVRKEQERKRHELAGLRLAPPTAPAPEPAAAAVIAPELTLEEWEARFLPPEAEAPAPVKSEPLSTRELYLRSTAAHLKTIMPASLFSKTLKRLSNGFIHGTKVREAIDNGEIHPSAYIRGRGGLTILSAPIIEWWLLDQLTKPEVTK